MWTALVSSVCEAKHAWRLCERQRVGFCWRWECNSFTYITGHAENADVELSLWHVFKCVCVIVWLCVCARLCESAGTWILNTSNARHAWNSIWMAVVLDMCSCIVIARLCVNSLEILRDNNASLFNSCILSRLTMHSQTHTHTQIFTHEPHGWSVNGHMRAEFRSQCLLCLARWFALYAQCKCWVWVSVTPSEEY